MRVSTVLFSLAILTLLLCAALAFRLFFDAGEAAALQVTPRAALLSGVLFLVLAAALVWLTIAHTRLYRHFKAANGKLAEEATERVALMDAARAQLVALMEDLAEAVIVADPDHQVVGYNSAALWFFEPIMNLQSGAVIATEGDALDYALTTLTERLEDGGDPTARHSMPISFAADSKSGEEIILSGHMALVPDSNGGIAGYILSFDTTGGKGDTTVA